MTTLSAEVAEAVRLRDAAAAWKPGTGRCSAGFKLNYDGPCKKCRAEVHEPCGRRGETPPALLEAAAPQHVDLIERLNNALKATQDAYVETAAALTLEQDRNEGLRAELEHIRLELAQSEERADAVSTELLRARAKLRDCIPIAGSKAARMKP